MWVGKDATGGGQNWKKAEINHYKITIFFGRNLGRSRQSDRRKNNPTNLFASTMTAFAFCPTRLSLLFLYSLRSNSHGGACTLGGHAVRAYARAVGRRGVRVRARDVDVRACIAQTRARAVGACARDVALEMLRSRSRLRCWRHGSSSLRRR